MAANLGMLLQFLAAAGLTLWLLPASVLRWAWAEAPHPLTSLTLGLAYWIFGLWILAWLHSVELATLVALAAAGIVLAGLLRRRRPIPQGAPAASSPLPYAGFLDALESDGGGVTGLLTGRARLIGLQIRQHTKALGQPTALVLLGAAAGSFYEVIRRPFSQIAPGVYHGYFYLLSGQQLAVNQGPFLGGVFPEGGALLASLWSTLLFQNPLNVWRFMPLVSAAVLLGGAGYLAYRVSGRRGAAIVTVSTLGISAFGTLGAIADSPDAFLLLRLGVAFVPLALAFALRYWEQGHPRHLVVVASAAFVAVSFEPWAGIFLLLPLVAAALWLTRVQSGKGRAGWQTVLAALGGLAVGVLPLLAGMVGGERLDSFAWDVYWPSNLLTTAKALWSHPAFPLLLILASVVLLFLIKRRDPRMIAIGAALLSVVIAGVWALLRPGSLVSDVTVAGQYLAIMGVPALAGWLGSVGVGARRVRVPSSVLAGVSVLGIVLFPPRVAPLSRFEPVGSGRTLVRAEQQFPAYQWTLVSPGLQYSEVLGRGWHVELSQFVRVETMAEARNPRYRLSENAHLHIETPVTLVSIALRLPGMKGPVTARDASLPLPPGGSVTYRGLAGAAVEARALVWARAYLASHPDSASVYYQSPALLVVKIQQPGP